MKPDFILKNIIIAINVLYFIFDKQNSKLRENFVLFHLIILYFSKSIWKKLMDLN